MTNRRKVLCGVVVACASVGVGCGGGGGTAASSSSTSSRSSSSSSISQKVKDAYESALADLGSAFGASADARTEVSDSVAVTTDLPLLRDLRDAWFDFDKKVRDVDFPAKFQVKVNDVLTANGTVIADLDKFIDTIRPEAYNALLVTLDKDIESFRSLADKLADELGVQGTRDSGSSSSSKSSKSSGGSAAAITDAKATRDQLVQLAQQDGSVDPTAEPAITSWPEALPGVDFIGSALAASPTEVSGFTIVTSKAKSEDFLAFAVADSAGNCAGAVLEFDSAGTAVVSASTLDDITGTCSADTVSEALGF